LRILQFVWHHFDVVEKRYHLFGPFCTNGLINTEIKLMAQMVLIKLLHFEHCGSAEQLVPIVMVRQ